MIEENRRRAFLGPHHVAQLRVIEEILNAPPIIENCNVPKLDFSGIFFSTMIQCGVEEFVVVTDQYPQVKHDLNSEFLSERVAFDKNLYKTYFQIYGKVLPLFAEYEEDEKLGKNDKSELHSAKMLITDLLFQMKTNLGSVSVGMSPRPDLERLKVILKPEMYYPIRNLIYSIENDKLNLPIPTQSILQSNIEKYEKIIHSDIFVKYSKSHQNFQNQTVPKSKALSQICKEANKLQIRFAKYIDLKEFVISSFNKIPIGAEFFGGKIGGTVAEGVLKLFEPIYKNHLSNNQRQVIYEFSPITNEIFDERIFKRLKDMK
jgi:hypothetical protein